MLRLRILTILGLLLTLCITGSAQITTSSITGSVKNDKGELLEGATITATHEPSGTVYNTASKKGGGFTLPGLRIGGPYTVKIDFVGFKTAEFKDITLVLGEAFNISATMGEDVREIAAVTVSGRRKAAVERAGATTNIGQRQITTLPTLNRSLTDFTRLTPQANGTSFGGRDGRYNNTVIDGANLNNNFGLSNDLLPGGGNPISLDAIEEVSVTIASFDVRQAAFTGAGINAVTKSGTNTFKGTAYGYYRDQSFNGTNIKGTSLGTLAASSNKIIGGSIGGPIIKNKLFFFINGEYEQPSAVGNPWTPKGGSGAGNVSTVPIDSMKKLSDHLLSKYGYNTGAYDNRPGFANKNRKILGKIDWNINKVHKLTLKYSDYENTYDVLLNAQSMSFAGGAVFTVRNGTGTTSLSALPNSRNSLNALSFDNSNYGFKKTVRTGSVELNSNFGKFSNQLLGTITKNRETRTIPGQLFPFVDIFNNDGRNYMSFGTDPFSNNNDVINDVYNATDNFTYYAGKHTITAGASYEYQRVGNMFMGASQSYYAFNSLDDFINNRAPALYSLTYSLVPGKSAVYSAELKLGQLGLYLQDEFNISPNFKITAGLRADRPIYHEQPIENPQITALNLPNKDGVLTNYNTGRWPKSSWYWSPRVGFRWDAEKDKSLIIRGGTGIFTGRIPFVWLTNMPTNSAMYQTNQSVTAANRLTNYRFNPNPTAYIDSFPKTAGTFVPASFVVIDPNFKFPQVWRSNLAFDQKLGNDGWLLTMEALYTKDINAIVMRNANERAPDTRFAGNDNRPRYSVVGNASRRIYSGVSQAIVLENTSKGQSGSITAMISKTATKGFYGSAGYTFTYASDVTANPGSTAASVWSGNPTIGTQNSLELYNSQYVLPHRVVGSVSYRIEYLKHMATTVSLFYEGASQGSYSFITSNDMNGDGNSSDLMYIPKDASDIIFVAQAASGSNPARTAQEQSDAFFKLIENTPYLRKHKGQYAERNGAYQGWFNRWDAKILQDFFIRTGKTKHALQVSLDIINVANLLSHNWGIRQQIVYRNPLFYVGPDAATGKPTYRMNQVGGVLPVSVQSDITSSSTTWGLQLGVRYIFN